MGVIATVTIPIRMASNCGARVEYIDTFGPETSGGKGNGSAAERKIEESRPVCEATDPWKNCDDPGLNNTEFGKGLVPALCFVNDLGVRGTCALPVWSCAMP